MGINFTFCSWYISITMMLVSQLQIFNTSLPLLLVILKISSRVFFWTLHPVVGVSKNTSAIFLGVSNWKHCLFGSLDSRVHISEMVDLKNISRAKWVSCTVTKDKYVITFQNFINCISNDISIKTHQFVCIRQAQKYNRLRCLLRDKDLVICFYLG